MAEFTASELECLKSVAFRAADVAREITLSYFRQPGLAADNKASAGFDPVTVADREAEIAIRNVILQARPDDAVLGEEHGEIAGTSGLTWVLDPIDGTRSFVAGTPTWGTLISLRDENGPILGLIDQPYVGERFFGGFGVAELHRHGTKTPLSVRTNRSIGQAIMLSTFPEVGTDVERAGFDEVRQHVQLTRYGTDCYGYALLAAGTVDLVIEAGLKAYDVQAPIAVVEAAGGFITNWQGNPVHEGGRVLAAASRELHGQALDILAKVPGP